MKKRKIKVITEQVKRDLKSIVLDRFGDTPQYVDICYVLDRRLAAKHWIRPYLMYIYCHKIIDKRSLDLLMVCVELLNISTYQSNSAFDRKIESVNSLASNNQFIASHLTMNLIVSLLNTLSEDIAPEKLAAIIQRFMSANNEIYLGQHIDYNLLNFKNNPGILMEKEAAILPHYSSRCRYYGSTLTICAHIEEILSDNSPADRSTDLATMTSYFSYTLQLLNDLADITGMPGDENKFIFNDLRQGIVTYPTLLLLKSPSFPISTTFNKYTSKKYKRTVESEVLLSGTFRRKIEKLVQSNFDIIVATRKRHKEYAFAESFRLFKNVILQSSIFKDKLSIDV